MLIANKFEDVFEEVKGLPPHREIEFRIDFVEVARPIVMPLRWMAPKEQRELEMQVRDLLGKRIHSEKCFLMGCSSCIYNQGRWLVKIVCGLS